MNHAHHHEGHTVSEDALSCAMKMTFNWDTKGLCIIFDWWKVNDGFSMLISIIIIFFLALSYEKLRQFTVSFDKQSIDDRSSNRQLVRALLYGGQIAFSFLLMLIFMTYNAYLMLAIVVGAATGFYMFHKENFAERGMNCH